MNIIISINLLFFIDIIYCMTPQQLRLQTEASDPIFSLLLRFNYHFKYKNERNFSFIDLNHAKKINELIIKLIKIKMHFTS